MVGIDPDAHFIFHKMRSRSINRIVWEYSNDTIGLNNNSSDKKKKRKKKKTVVNIGKSWGHMHICVALNEVIVRNTTHNETTQLAAFLSTITTITAVALASRKEPVNEFPVVEGNTLIFPDTRNMQEEVGLRGFNNLLSLPRSGIYRTIFREKAMQLHNVFSPFEPMYCPLL